MSKKKFKEDVLFAPVSMISIFVVLFSIFYSVPDNYPRDIKNTFLILFAGWFCFCVGVLLNIIVMWANGYRMPVKNGNLTIYLERPQRHCIMKANSRFKYLADIILLKDCMFSIGDILMRFGLFVLTISFILIVFGVIYIQLCG